MNFILEPTGLTVAEIQANGGIMRPHHTLPPYRERKYRDHGFPTPTGKVELASTVVEKYAKEYGYDVVPQYRSLDEIYPQYADRETWPLLINTGSRRPQYMHTRTYRMKWIGNLEPNDLLDLHPQDAEKLGIQSGDRVRITTPSGSIGATANVTATVFPGAVHMYHGNEKANTSYLMDHDFLDPLSGYPGYKSFPCRVEKEV